MKLRIPILFTAVAIFMLVVIVVQAQETTPQAPLTREMLMAVPAPVMMIERDQLPLPGTDELGAQFLPNQNSEQPAYKITTSADDPQCDTGFDGYVNLEDLNIYPWLGVEGNNVAWGPFFNNIGPINYFGMRYNDLWITDDGFVVFDVKSNYHKPWMPQNIADPALPNNVVAPLWQDMKIVEDRATNRGVSAAQTPDGTIMVLEFDDLQLVSAPKNRYDMEIIMRRNVSHAKGAYEIVFAYDNLEGTLAGPLTIGVENWAGTNATALVNKGDATGIIKDGLMVCFDAVAGSSPTDVPQDVQASDGDHEDKVHVTWAGAEDAAAYEVYRAASARGEKSKLGQADDNFFHDMTAEPGTTYAYWITTCNTYGCSEHSDYDTGWRALPSVEARLLYFIPTVFLSQ